MKKRTWQHQLANVITDPVVLCRMLQLDPRLIKDIQPAAHQFPLRVPHAFLSRIEKGNPNDPLLKQILPLGIEMQPVEGYIHDPLQEGIVSPVTGLLHKYKGRVLFTLTGSCAVNCRYCFRRHYDYSENVPGLSQWQPALDYIMSDTTIQEIILSGGEPLLVKDALLSEFVTKLERIPHLKRLRFHTRFPVVIPDRITDDLVNRLQHSRLKIILVLHCNHANELDNFVAEALFKCRHFTLLNQSVLLKGINNSVDALVELSERLFEINVLPYYLHMLDPVAGTAHFNVTEATAKQLIQSVSHQLPGYLVPKLVREVFGEGSKRVIG